MLKTDVSSWPPYFDGKKILSFPKMEYKNMEHPFAVFLHEYFTL